ncbi:MAG: glycosyltransferase [Planctomycetes bacterium]|nr:glycosyltransferase [Planctomycetota bacterium]
MFTVVLVYLIPAGLLWAYLLRESFITFRRDITLKADKEVSLPDDPPMVTIMVPARNEEHNIRECVESLLAQDYPNFEAIVANDRSTDRTAEIVREMCAEHPTLRLVEVHELPEGWTGKNHALHTAVQEAQGEYFVFTDADTRHAPSCISQCMNHVLAHGVDMLSLVGEMDHRTLWEKMFVPPIAATLMLWFQQKHVNDRSSHVAFANGQYILISRAMYEKCGGHERVKHELLEDIAMSKEAKKEGGHINLAYGGDMYRARMYDSFGDFFRGWSRILHSALNKNAGRLLLQWVLTALCSICPFVAAVMSVIGVAAGADGALLCLIVSIPVCAMVIWAVSRTYPISKSKRRYALLHPINCLVILAVLAHAFYTAATGSGIVWRGTVYSSK